MLGAAPPWRLLPVSEQVALAQQKVRRPGACNAYHLAPCPRMTLTLLWL